MLGLSMKSYYTTITTKHWNEINGHGAFELGSARCLRAAPFQSQHADTTRGGSAGPGSKKGKSQYNGCDGHYNEKGHSVLAADIMPQFLDIMGWKE